MFELSAEDSLALYYPFANKCDYATAVLFTEFKISKSFVNYFAKDSRSHKMNQHCSFNNGNQLEAKLHEVLWGIKNNKWTQTTMKLDTEIADMELTLCTLYYCDVI